MDFKRIGHEAQVLQALETGATVIAASERLARAVRLAHADAQRRRGAQVWERPEVLSWNAFLRRQFALWEETRLESGPHLLGEHQAEALWETVIHDTPDAPALLQPSAAARAAQEAWQLCHAYGLTVAVLEREASGDDARQFVRWAAEFAQRCEARRLLDDACLPDHLAALLGSGKLASPSHCVLLGFDELTPQQEKLLDALRGSGAQVEVLPAPEPVEGRRRRVSQADAEAEMESAARWVRALLEQQPKARIGIVVQDLAEQREAFARILDRVLCPGSVPGDAAPRPYNFSMGHSLAACPVVSDALLLLQWRRWRVPFNQASRLLRSPFLAAADREMPARARLEVRLRETNLEQVGLARLASLAQQDGDTPVFKSMLDKLQILLREMSQRQLPSAWSRTFGETLQVFGWPGERTPDSHEHQAVQALREGLSEFAQLDAVLPLLELDEALSRFTRRVTRHEFQPRVGDVPVQVLGMPEAAGMQFDHLWIMGLTDDVWPPSPRPDPFIPWTLQRRHGLPHASAARELDYATRLTARLLSSAPDVVVSTPERNADTELRPSPLVTDLEEGTPGELVQSAVQLWRERLQQEAPVALAEFSDVRGPAVGDAERISGGTRVIQSQAACPFQAFAIYRLGAEALGTPAPGLSPLERGALLHDVLFRLWKELRDHTTLAALLPEQRLAKVQGCVAQAVNQLASRNPDPFTPRFRELEQERLVQLVSQWLNVEAARGPFAVEEREEPREVKLGRLTLNARVDRVDRLPDGGRVIVDYKSGEANPRSWAGARPDEPQLPIYAISEARPPAAVLFAQLRTGELAYRGYAEADGVVPDVTAFDSLKRKPDDAPDWAALLAGWRAAVLQLAEEFMAGDARVMPKDPRQTCRYCHLSTLCRIHERDGLAEDDDAAA